MDGRQGSHRPPGWLRRWAAILDGRLRPLAGGVRARGAELELWVDVVWDEPAPGRAVSPLVRPATRRARLRAPARGPAVAARPAEERPLLLALSRLTAELADVTGLGMEVLAGRRRG